MKTVNYIVAGGKNTPCAAPIVHWREHGRTWAGRKPRKTTDLLVAHWTGGEGSLDTFYGVCVKAGQSAHFWIDADEREDGFATAYQFGDADQLLAHCKGANARSVGIEARNRANLSPVRATGPKLVTRAVLRETINGREFAYCAFLPSQVRTYIALTLSICEAYGIPLVLPTEPVKPKDGVHYPVPPTRIIPRVLTQAEFDVFKGVIGHFHWTEKKKQDPGLALLTAMAVAFDPKTAPDVGRAGHLREMGPAE